MKLRSTAVGVSLVCMLGGLGRFFLDWRFVPEFAAPDDPPAKVAWMLLGILVLFGVWTWAIVRMAQESRGWTIVLAALNIVVNFAYLGAGTAVSFCPTPCTTIWPLMEIMIWANLVMGVAAAALNLLLLRKPVLRGARARGT
ncbi:hypothetical protein [Pendulispora albinea]|uniref:Uncharacterized protein n=1 Tax=Pendulispora albinea TaxID=2741071 RepID=A0ABZ2MBQ0_9BACT